MADQPRIAKDDPGANLAVGYTSGSAPPLANKPRLLKWPRGSMIYPEINDPQKPHDVFLLTEELTPPDKLQHLHLFYGSQLFARKRYEQAKREYLKAVASGASESLIQKRLGFIYLNAKNYKKAELAYRKVLELNPQYTPAIAKLGVCFVAQKKYARAEKQFKQAIQADPRNADYHRDLGHFYYYLKKDYREARKAYKKALKLNPRLKTAQGNIKAINRKFKKWKDQEANFEFSESSEVEYDRQIDSEPTENSPHYSEKTHISEAMTVEDGQDPLF